MNAAEPSANGQRTVLDMSSQRLARLYAEALLDAAEKRGQAEELLAQLDGLFDEVFAANPAAQTLLLGGGVGRRARAEVIQHSFVGKVHDLLANLMLVLSDRERLYLLPAIRAAAHQVAEERAGRLPVQVATAVPLPEDQRERLREQLRGAFRKEPVFQEKVDPELLGGLVVRVGDWLFDASVRTSLNNLRKQLIERA